MLAALRRRPCRRCIADRKAAVRFEEVLMSSRSLMLIVCALSAAGCAASERSPTAPNAFAPAVLASESDLEPLGLGDAPGARAPGGPQSATGHGNLTVGGALRTFSFSAIRQKDGEVAGEFQLKNRASDVVIHGELTCLLAIARPTQGAAFMGGVVTRVDGDAPGFAPGTPVVFSAFDNGEGADNFPDAMTLVEATTPQVVARHCAVGLRVGGGAVPIEDGNIQVRP